MGRSRIVVGAAGHDRAAVALARTLRDAGHEVVYVGGGQSPEQLARAAVAEDATRVVVPAGDADAAEVRRWCGELGADEIEVGEGD